MFYRRVDTKTKRDISILLLLIFIVSITIGYALLASNLNITGSTAIASSKWDIHWENVSPTTNLETTNITAPATITDDTTVEYAVKLDKPGDYYEFLVDAVNDGTIDGMISVFGNKVYAANGTTEKELGDYLEYSISYSDGSALSKNQLLKAGQRKTYKVRLQFKEDIEASHLPSDVDSYRFKFNVTYVQADNQNNDSIITFNANTGTGSMENQTIPDNVATNLAKNTFKKENYLFDGWNTKSDGSGTSYEDEEEVTNIGTVTLYAQWRIDSFPKVFNQSGACTFNGSSSNITGEDCSLYTNNKYIDTGIKLYSSTNLNKDYEIGFTIEEYVPENNEYQATLMNTKNEASGYPGVVFRKQSDTEFELASRKTSSANQNYRFAHSGVRDIRIYRIDSKIYYKIDDGERTLLNDLTQYNPSFDLNVWFGAAPTNASATAAQRYFKGTLSNMYIRLGTYVDDSSYTVTLNPNGGSVDPEYIVVSDGDSVGTLPTPVKAHNTFDGWYTSLTSGVEVDESYIPNKNITLYAHWTEIPTYTVTFNSNGGSSVDPIDVDEGETLGTLPIPTKNGKSFGGWYTEIDGGTRITESFSPTRDIEVFAHWLDTTFPKVFEQTGACTFNGSSGTITGEDCSDYVGQKYIDTGISLYSEENISKDYEIGFTIESYTPSDNESRATLMNTKLEATGYPGVVFRRNDETDNFILQSRKTSSANEQKTFAYNTVTSVKIYRISNEIYYSINGEDKVLLNNLTEYNPTFNLTTWFGAAPSNEAGTSAQRYLTGTLSNMYIKLGQYEEVGKYNITLNPNGGEVNPTTITIDQGDSIGTLPTPTLAENHFDGWYTDLTDGIEVDKNYIPDGNITLYAKWRNYVYYEVTFDKNDSSAVGTMSNQSIADGIPTPLNENQYTKEGYGFVGWNTEIDGTGTSYLDQADITLTGNITLYAQWVKTYTLTFDKNNPDAVGEPYSIELVSGISTQIPKESFYKYTLGNKGTESWNTKSDYTGLSYYMDQSITITEDSTLYSKFGKPYVSETIYWALQDNDSDDTKETLVISSHEVDGIQKGSFSGDTKFIGGESEDAWQQYDGYVSNIKIEGLVAPKYTYDWFAGTGSVASIFIVDLTNLNVSNVTNLSWMFERSGYDAATYKLDLSGWDTSSVTDMQYMFYFASCNSTTFDLNLSGWDTSSITDMNNMFYYAGCNSTTFDLNLSGWDTSSVTDMSYMFESAGKSATTWNVGDISGWNTSNVTNMYYMFSDAGYSATTWNVGDLSGWDTSSVTNMGNMFSKAGYNSATFDLNLSGWNTSSVTDMQSMFSKAGYSATTWNIGDLSGWDTSKVTIMNSMFSSAGYSATTWNVGDISGWNTSNVYNMGSMFSSAGYNSATFALNLSGWDTSKVSYMGSMFSSAGYNSTTFALNLSSWNTSRVSYMSHMFESAGYSATTWNIGGLSSWNTSRASDMSYMFSSSGYNSTTFDLNLSGWNTSSVTDMSSMFESAGYSATTWNIGDLSGWDTSKVTTMNSMFSSAGYNSATFALNISGWNVLKVTNMNFMFSNAGYNSTTFDLNLSDWNTSKLINIKSMFNNAGYSATTWSITIPQTNCNGINNTSSKMYGISSAVFVEVDTGRQFTLATN